MRGAKGPASNRSAAWRPASNACRCPPRLLACTIHARCEDGRDGFAEFNPLSSGSVIQRDVPPPIWTILSWNFPVMIPDRGDEEFR